MKKRKKEIFKRAAEVLKLGAYIRISDYTDKNNTEYGIYVVGNYSKIYNNVIKYNGNYGIKLYSSFGNCIYGNAFISNNIDHPEHIHRRHTIMGSAYTYAH